MIVYKATNLINNKIYIGKTIQTLKRRVSQHKYDALRKHSQIKFYRAIRKYGFENFKWEIICECNTNDELCEKEIYFIKLYNSIKNGYNTTSGGEGVSGFKHSEETKRKVSESRKGLTAGENHHMYGKTHTEEVKRKIIESNKNRKITKEFREKVGDASRGSRNGSAKLNEEDVVEIKKLLMKGEHSQKEIALMFNVSNYAIHDIKRGKTWSHVTIEERDEKGWR